MPRPASWSAEAWNPVPESENRIHSDALARAYGFRGALVPGVVVSAYLLHPAAVAWGRAWLERGRAHVIVSSPVYDGERFRVEVGEAGERSYDATLIDDRGVSCARASVSLPHEPPAPPVRRGDPPIDRDAERPAATRSVMEGLQRTGLHALPAVWREDAEITGYLRDPDAMAPVFRATGCASPAFVLGLTNWLLGRNVRMSPWLHLETTSQHYRAIEPGTEIVAEGAIAGLFEKKGHEFVDLDVEVYDRRSDTALASARLRAIYRMREP